jgi:uncharacterized protein YfcZ (UPF0381/DUF406 family)
VRVARVVAADPTSIALLLSGMGAAPRRAATAYVASVDVGTVLLRRHVTGGTEAVVAVRASRRAAEAFLRDLARLAEERADAA